MTDIQQKCITELVNNVYKDNHCELERFLFNGYNDTMSEQKAYATMMINAVHFSIDLSTKLILDILDSSGAISLEKDEDTLRRILLSSAKE